MTLQEAKDILDRWEHLLFSNFPHFVTYAPGKVIELPDTFGRSAVQQVSFELNQMISLKGYPLISLEKVPYEDPARLEGIGPTKMEPSFWKVIEEDVEELRGLPYIPQAYREMLHNLHKKVQVRLGKDKGLLKVTDNDLALAYTMLLGEIIKEQNTLLTPEPSLVFDERGEVHSVRHAPKERIPPTLFSEVGAVLPIDSAVLLAQGIRDGIYSRMHEYVTQLCPHEQNEQFHRVWNEGLLETLLLSEGKLQITGYQMTVFCESNPLINLDWLLTNRGKCYLYETQEAYMNTVITLRAETITAKQTLVGEYGGIENAGSADPEALFAHTLNQEAAKLESILAMLIQNPNTVFFGQDFYA